MKNITIKLFHNMRPNFNSYVQTTDVFREVGFINIDSRFYKSDVIHMDELYAKTQNISGGWPSHRTVQTNLVDCRSTSVGDVMLVDDKFYVVANHGFSKLLQFPKILQTYYDCPSIPSFSNENIRIPVFNSLMEAMHDITGEMIKAQEAYVYRKGKLVDRIEYDRMSIASKVTGQLVTLRQTLALKGINKHFTDLQSGVELLMQDTELQELVVLANKAFYQYENVDTYTNRAQGRSSEYENARCEYSDLMVQRFSNAVGMDEATMNNTSIPYSDLSDEFFTVCEIVNIHHLTMGSYLYPSQV